MGRLGRDMFETSTPLIRKIYVVLRERKCSRLTTPHMPKKDGALMGNDFNVYCCYPRAKGNHTNDCHVLKRDIEALIHRG